MVDKTNKPHREPSPAEERPERIDTSTVLAELNCDEDHDEKKTRPEKLDTPTQK